MPPWWGKSSSKDVKKTAKENLIDTFQRLISSNEHKGSKKSRGSRRRDKDTATETGCWSIAQSRSTSPTKEVSRCQSFAADRPLAQPLPLPRSQGRVTHATSDITDSKANLETTSDITDSKANLEKREGQLLPLPIPNRHIKPPEATEPIAELPTASVSSNCSIDSDDPGDSQLQSPVGNDAENATRITTTSSSRYAVQRMNNCFPLSFLLLLRFILTNHKYFSCEVLRKKCLLVLSQERAPKSQSQTMLLAVTKLCPHLQEVLPLIVTNPIYKAPD
jgi:hypothetical protein